MATPVSTDVMCKSVVDAVKNKLVPNVIGLPGIGKTEGIKQLAEDEGWGFTKLNGSTLNYGELSLQRPDPTRPATIDVPHKMIQRAVRDALKRPDRLHILFVDEVNRGEDYRVGNELMNFFQDRILAGLSMVEAKRLTEAGRKAIEEGKSEKELVEGIDFEIVSVENEDELPNNLRFVLASNPSNDMDCFGEVNFQTNNFDIAQLSRSVLVFYKPDLLSWTDSFALRVNSETGETNIHPAILDFLHTNPSLFHAFHPDKLIHPNPRAWDAVSKLYRSYLNHNDEFMFQTLVEGLVGRDATTALISFLSKAYHEIIKPEDVFTKKYTEVPQDILDLIANETAIRQRMTVINLLTHLDKMKEEKKHAYVRTNAKLTVQILHVLPAALQYILMLRVEKQTNLQKVMMAIPGYIENYERLLDEHE